MSGPLSDVQWAGLLERSNEFTCYSAAIATWLAVRDDGWPAVVNPGLWLRLTEEQNGLYGFAYFPSGLRSRLGLVRTGSENATEAVDGVLAELERSGAVIVAADGYHLPWHVAAGREHLPHWFVLTGRPDRLEIADPFACRNQLGNQLAERRPVGIGELAEMLSALPGTSAIHRLREELAFGDRTTAYLERGFQWFLSDGSDADVQEPAGSDGPAAIHRLATHFRDRGQDLAAYEQADDIWSIARHRAFLSRYAAAAAQSRGDEALAGWVREHADPLAKRWGHIAPLIMQATLSLAAGRTATSSVPDTLDELAEREQQAAQAFPTAAGAGTI